MRLDVLEAVALPERVFRGGSGELVAVYREHFGDGFIITAFMTRRMGSIERRELVWSAQK